MTMTSLTKCPVVTFFKVSRENVKFLEDVKAIEPYYGKPLKARDISYGDDDYISSLVVRVGGRKIAVDLTRTGVSHTLRFQTYEYTPQYEGTDEMFINRVR